MVQYYEEVSQDGYDIFLYIVFNEYSAGIERNRAPDQEQVFKCVDSILQVGSTYCSIVFTTVYFPLVQFHNMILCCCIYITVVLALERYRAVWHPVEYHHVVNAGSPWKRSVYVGDRDPPLKEPFPKLLNQVRLIRECRGRQTPSPKTGLYLSYRVFYCISPVVVFSVLFNVPKFFEVTFQTRTYPMPERDEDGEIIGIVSLSHSGWLMRRDLL